MTMQKHNRTTLDKPHAVITCDSSQFGTRFQQQAAAAHRCLEIWTLDGCKLLKWSNVSCIQVAADDNEAACKSGFTPKLMMQGSTSMELAGQCKCSKLDVHMMSNAEVERPVEAVQL